MKIFNIKQASVFILLGCEVLNCGVGDRNKIYIEFKNDDLLRELMIKWKNKEFM